jgi:hypothetical protein
MRAKVQIITAISARASSRFSTSVRPLVTNVPGPAYRVRRIHVDDLADDKPVKKHEYRGEVLLERRLGKPRSRFSIYPATCTSFTYSRSCTKRCAQNPKNLHTALKYPPPRVLVADIRDEEIDETLRRPRLFEKQGRRCSSSSTMTSVEGDSDIDGPDLNAAPPSCFA